MPKRCILCGLRPNAVKSDRMITQIGATQALEPSGLTTTSRMLPRQTLPLFIALFSMFGCGPADTSHSSTYSRPEAYAVLEEAGTREMEQLLEDVHQDALANAMDYFHLNSRRAELLFGVMQDAPEDERLPHWYNYASELLYAGETAAAIAELSKLVDESGIGIGKPTKPIFDLLAIAYMRQGEQNNCIANPSARACILPISGTGIHVQKEASRQAIALYQQILERFRGDLQARWLLNIAYMTVGEYPDGVPQRWLIPGIESGGNAPIKQFHDVARNVGVDHVGLAGGVSIEDFNRDGFLDILATSYGTRGPMRLYLNDGNGGFNDRTRESGLEGLYGGLNTVHADFDNDGFVDIFVLRGAWLGDAGAHPNSLIRNNGDGTFEDVTLRAGVLSYHPTQTAAWTDFNNDGWVDLFVGNESDREINVFTGDLSKRSTPHPSELFINNGDGTFSEVSKQVGIDVYAYVKAAVWGDVNDDGLQDLYLSVMGGPNRLYVNRGGEDRSNWHFEERAGDAGVQEPFFSFPAWFWDYDNDGDQDIFVSSYDSRHFTRMGYDVAAEYLRLPVAVEKSRLYRNRGDGTFEDVTEPAGLDKLMYTMGSNFGDLDNDGFPDFYLGTGGIDLFSLMPNRMFYNRDGQRFDEITFEGGFGHIQKGHGVAFGDLDNDGDQDIYCVMGGALEGDVFQNLLFENPGHDNAWLSLQLQGSTANRDAIGARIRLTVIDGDGRRRTIHTTVSTGGSFGASSLRQEIGLGEATKIEEVQVVWPNADRSSQTFTDLQVNRHYWITEGERPIPLSPDKITFRQVAEDAGHHRSTGGESG